MEDFSVVENVENVVDEDLARMSYLACLTVASLEVFSRRSMDYVRDMPDARAVVECDDDGEMSVLVAGEYGLFSVWGEGFAAAYNALGDTVQMMFAALLSRAHRETVIEIGSGNIGGVMSGIYSTAKTDDAYRAEQWMDAVNLFINVAGYSFISIED